MPVACMVDLYWLYVKVGLKLAVCVKGLLLDILNLLLLSVPHRHKALLQTGGACPYSVLVHNNLEAGYIPLFCSYRRGWVGSSRWLGLPSLCWKFPAQCS